MKKTVVTLALLVATISQLCCQAITIDVLTGYRNAFQSKFNEYFRPLVYLPEHIATDPPSELSEQTIADLRGESSGLKDSFFDFSKIVEDSISSIESGRLDILTFDDKNVLHCAVFVEPEGSPQFSKPTILINRFFLTDSSLSLAKSSILREMKAAQDYFARSRNNQFTDWDEVENLLYRLDSYYAQTHFIKTAYLEKHKPVTPLENYLVTSYDKDYLGSFLFYFYGIDRQLVVDGYSSVQNVLTKKSTIDECLEYLRQDIARWVNPVEATVDDASGLSRFSTNCTFVSYYSFLLRHRVFSRESVFKREVLQGLIDDMQRIDESHRQLIARFQRRILKMQEDIRYAGLS